MVTPQANGVHAEGANPQHRPAFPQGIIKILELGNELGPDRHHPDKQRDRRQSRCFFHENPQHRRLLDLEHRGNIVPFLF
jgi:hypothetical protein